MSGTRVNFILLVMAVNRAICFRDAVAYVAVGALLWFCLAGVLFGSGSPFFIPQNPHP